MIVLSLRWRLILAVTAAASLVVVAAAAAIWLAGAHERFLTFDQAVRDHARAIRPRLEEIAWHHAREAALPPEELPESGHDGLLVLLRGPGGEVWARSPGAPEPGVLPRHPGPDGVLVDAVLPAAGAVRWLVLDIVERPPPGRRPEERPRRREAPPAQLVLIRPTAPLRAGLVARGWLLASLAAMVSAVVGGLVAIIVHRLLRPVRQLGDAISATMPGGGDTLAVPGLPAELLPVQARLNELLVRMDRLLERERQTNASIAHELRTPLAGLRAKLELALLREREPAQIAELCRQGLANLALLQGLVDNLLLLARLEAGQMAPRREAVELAEAVAAVWSLHEAAAAERGLTLARAIEPALALTTDPGWLRAILGNLLANAVAYATPGSAIRLEAAEEGAEVRLLLANAGCTVAPADAGRVFEPFWRADSARTIASGHCGLGLSLVQRLTAILGGTVLVEVVDGSFRVHLRLPLETADRNA
jgi:signal transduction histidine kinase